MVINDFHIIRMAVMPRETDTPLKIDSDAVLSFAQQAVLLGFHAKQFVALGLHLRLLLPYDFGLSALVAAETAQVAQTAVHLLKVLGRQNKLPLRHLHAVVK